MKSAPEFIASYWTLAGNVVPLGPPEEEASPHDLIDRLRSAAELGYAGIGLMHSDLCKILRRHNYLDIRNLLIDYDMKYLELEFLVGWMADGEEYAKSERVFGEMLKAADEIGVRHIKIGPDMEAKTWPLDKMIERFAGLCRRAEGSGTSIALEIMPWSNITELDTATAIVHGANMVNGGLLLDIWHLARGGVDYREIEKVPAGLIRHVEINDADREVRGTLIEDTLNHRKFCGDGDLEVVAFLDAIATQGYKGPYGIEILSAEQRLRRFEEVAARAINSARREFAKL